MIVVPLVQLFLLMFAVRAECTVEILRPMATPYIQLSSVRVTYKYGQVPLMALYSVILTGPSDTEVESGLPLTEVSRYRDFSVFKTEREVNNYDVLSVKSTSISEELIVVFDREGKDSDIGFENFKDSFFGQNCSFELKKETDGRITTYSFRKEGVCQSENEFENISDLFVVVIRNKQRHIFTEVRIQKKFQ